LQLRASITKACTPPANATSMLHLSSAAKFAKAPAARSWTQKNWKQIQNIVILYLLESNTSNAHAGKNFHMLRT
jgi:hypothetical protein